MATGTVTQFLIGGSNRSKYPAQQGAEYSVNMCKSTNAKNAYMESLPGLRRLSTIGGKCRGTWVSTRGLKAEGSNEDMFACFGNVLYRIKPDGSRTKLFNVASNGRRICFAEAGGPRAIMLVCDGVNLFAYFLEEGTYRQVQLPSAVEGDGHTVRPTHCVVINGVIVINDVDSGYAYYSIPYPLSSDTREVFDTDADGNVQYESDNITVKKKPVDAWEYCFYDNYGTPQFFNSESNSDSINGLVGVGNVLYVFGPKSVEIYTYAGEEYATWSRQYFSAVGEFGLEAPDSLFVVGRNVFFVSNGRQYGKCVMAVNGTVFSRVSEDWIDHELNDNTSTSYGFGYGIADHQYYVLQLPTLKKTLCYDASLEEWHERASRSPDTGLETRWRVSSVANFRSQFYAFTEDGMVAKYYDNYWYEDWPQGKKSVMVRHRQGPVFTNDLKPFVIEELALECNTGSAPEYTENAEVLLEVSKDGGVTFGNMRHAKFGRTGDYSHRVRWHNLGMNRLCVIRITFSEPMDFVLTNCSVRAGKTGAQI